MRIFSGPIARRLALALAIGLILGWVLSEGAFLLLRDKSDHTPGRVVLVIPAGTASRVAVGEEPPGIPADLSFVVGDTLVIKNEDSAFHQVGPILAPPGTSASLTLDQADKYAFTCSIRPSRYLGLDVRPRVTLLTRLFAVLMSGPPMGVLIGLYSLVIWPIRQPETRVHTGQQAAETAIHTGRR